MSTLLKKIAAVAFVGLILIVIMGLWEHRAVASPPPVDASVATQQAYWLDRVNAVGGDSAYKEFETFVDPMTANKKHAEAHIFGGALYMVEGLSGLPTCDTQFSLGCFHEFLGKAISSLGLSVVTELNKTCFKETGNSPLACQHGIGHGIVADIGYDLSSLKKSIAICKTLSGINRIGGCYGGVYMEYNMQTMLGTDGAPRQAGADLMRPCDELTTPDQPTCYFWQPLWWHTVFDEQGIRDQTVNYQKIGALCTRVPANSRQFCFEGIGNNIPTDIRATTSIEESARKLCVAASSDAKDQLDCLSFLANSLLTGGAGIKGNALLVCRGLTGEQYQYCASAATRVSSSRSTTTPAR